MPDPTAPAVDITQPMPDEGHDAIRRGLVAAIDDLRNTSSGVDDSYLLTDTLFNLLDSAMADNTALADRNTALEAAVADLQPTVPITGDLPPVPAP